MAKRIARSFMAYRITVWKATGKPPFSMLMKHKLLLLITMPNLYIEEETELEKVEILKFDLDFVEKRRECAQV